MKKYLKLLIALSPIISASAIALKFKPPKMEVFNFNNPLNEEKNDMDDLEYQHMLNEMTCEYWEHRAGKATRFPNANACDKGNKTDTLGIQDSNIDELKEKLSRSCYAAKDVYLNLRDILNKNQEHILDNLDYQKAYIKLLKDLKNVMVVEQENDIIGDLLFVARHLHDPDYLMGWFKNSILKEEKTEGQVAQSNHLVIEDIPQENRKLDDYIRSFECAREISVDRYIEICRLLLEDIQSLTEKSAMNKKEGKSLLANSIMTGYDYFEDKEALDNFIIEQEEALGSTIGLFRDPNYSAEEFNKNINNHSKDVIDLVYSAKEDLKTLSYIGRKIRSFQKRGVGFAIINNSKHFKRPQKAYEYLVEHADEWRGSSEVLDIVITDMRVGIFFERR